MDVQLFITWSQVFRNVMHLLEILSGRAHDWLGHGLLTLDHLTLNISRSLIVGWLSILNQPYLGIRGDTSSDDQYDCFSTSRLGYNRQPVLDCCFRLTLKLNSTKMGHFIGLSHCFNMFQPSPLGWWPSWWPRVAMGPGSTAASLRQGPPAVLWTTRIRSARRIWGAVVGSLSIPSS